ncbi:MAG: F0F1 ATP synthase subunit epsilon [Candidatus Aminicenantes bacterium]|nr:F0F1 ATP synthase subunit epsilon [Candidatus Aminicenantes bacterium]
MTADPKARMQLKVISPQKLLVETEVLEVQVPGLDGYLGLWPGHRPLNACLGKGELIYKTVIGREERVSLRSGLLQVANDKILVFTDMEEDD